MVAATGLGFFGAPPELIGHDPVLRHPFPLGKASALAIALCGDAIAEIWRRRPGKDQTVRVRLRDAAAAIAGYLTGYLAARGVLEALLRRADKDGSWHVKASLCQTGMWLSGLGPVDESLAPGAPDMFMDLLVETDTPFGRLRHLAPALWNRSPRRSGTDRRHCPGRTRQAGRRSSVRRTRDLA